MIRGVADANALIGADRFVRTMQSGDPNEYSSNFAISTGTPLSRLLPVPGNGVVEIRVVGGNNQIQAFRSFGTVKCLIGKGI